jgi:hypothetical protein
VRSICVREGLDVVAQCREQEKNPKKFDFIGNTDYTEIDYLDANKKQRVGNGRWCNSPVKCECVCLYISVSLRQWQFSFSSFFKKKDTYDVHSTSTHVHIHACAFLLANHHSGHEICSTANN